MPSEAFADESARGQRYFVGVARVEQRDLKAVRRLARSYCVPGQRRWHFTKERNSRRAQILTALVECGLICAWVGVGKGDQVAVRAHCMRRLGADTLGWDLDRIVIESREGRDEQDRRVLFAILHNEPRVQYKHRTPAQEPMLWIADAVAWCYGGGGLWRQRANPMISKVWDVGQP